MLRALQTPEPLSRAGDLPIEARTETHAEAVARAGDLARWLAIFGPDEIIAVVSHGAIESLLTALLAQEPGEEAVWFELANTATSLLRLERGRASVR